MEPLWLVRLSRWVRRPPSRRQAMVILAVVAMVLALAGIEAIWGWPEALTPTRAGGRLGLRP